MRSERSERNTGLPAVPRDQEAEQPSASQRALSRKRKFSAAQAAASDQKAATARPTNNQLQCAPATPSLPSHCSCYRRLKRTWAKLNKNRYKAHFSWEHYAFPLLPAVRAALPKATTSCASVTTAFLQARSSLPRLGRFSRTSRIEAACKGACAPAGDQSHK